MSIFTEREIKRRRDSLLRRMDELKVNAVFVHTADNVFYLSGAALLSEWGRPMYLSITSDGSTALIAAMLEEENIEQNASLIDDILLFDDSENVFQSSCRLAIDFIKSHNNKPAKVGVEKSVIPAELLNNFKAALPNTEFIDIGDAIADLRIVKSEEEIEILRVGGDLAKIGAQAFIGALDIGVSELEVSSRAVAAINGALSQKMPEAASSSYAYCHFGSHTLVPHNHPTGRRLKSGDVIGLNVFPVIWGYCMELERTLIFGPPTDEQIKALETITESFMQAKDMVSPGVNLKDVDLKARAYLEERGYTRYVLHGTGHAHGIMIGAAGREEKGEVRSYNMSKFLPNMVTSIEPGIYIPGLGGFRHSDVMWVTEDAAICLTECNIGLSGQTEC